MIEDPYKTLGVSRDASDEDLKKAYRTLAKKYHPDNYSGSPLADVAEEKMKEVNDAYDRVKKEREGGGAADSTFGGGAYGGSSETSPRFARVREMINGGKFADAELILDSTPTDERTAEWFFLKGCVSYRAGHVFDAQRYFERACYLDPTNSEYRAAKDSVSGTAQTFSRSYRNTRGSTCDVCDYLCCFNLLCGGCDGSCCTPC